MYGRVLNIGSPVNVGHPLNRGRVAWWYGIPQWAGGTRLRNIMPGNQYEGTLTNGPTWTPTGRGDVGVRFDGTDDFVDCGDGPDLSLKSFSVAFSFRRESTGRWDIVYRTGTLAGDNFKRLHIGYSNVNKCHFGFYGDDHNSTATVTDTNWHRWLATYNVTTKLQSLYLDGKLDSTRTATTGLASGAVGNTYLGRYRDTTSLWALGRAADVTVWSGRDLSASDAGLEWESSFRSYCTPNSPLNFLKNTAYSLPSAPAGNRRRRVLITAGGR